MDRAWPDNNRTFRRILLEELLSQKLTQAVVWDTHWNVSKTGIESKNADFLSWQCLLSCLDKCMRGTQAHSRLDETQDDVGLIKCRSRWVSTHGQRIIYLHYISSLCSYCNAFSLRGKCRLHPRAMPYLKFGKT